MVLAYKPQAYDGMAQTITASELALRMSLKAGRSD
jgi:hypothetical protein